MAIITFIITNVILWNFLWRSPHGTDPSLVRMRPSASDPFPSVWTS